jgi:intergrase/recombinase
MILYIAILKEEIYHSTSITCRTIFATFMRNNGIEQEIIDRLQGRLPKSIFLRYYYRPDIAIYIKGQSYLEKLYNNLITKYNNS